MECNPARPPPLAARRRGSRTFKSQIQFPECGKNSERRRCQRHFARKIAIALLSLSFVSRRILVSTPIRPLMLVLRSVAALHSTQPSPPHPPPAVSRTHELILKRTNERTGVGEEKEKRETFRVKLNTSRLRERATRCEGGANERGEGGIGGERRRMYSR